jgi:hypothetical protein
MMGNDAAQIVLDFSMYKQGKTMTARLGAFVQTLNVLPVSSAALRDELLQSAESPAYTAVRNRLAISSISNLLMISINGPRLRDWNAKKYMSCRGLKVGDMALWMSRGVGEVKHQKKKRCYRLFA